MTDLRSRLMHNDQPIAPARIADTPWKRMRGLLGERGIDGVLLFPDVQHVHTFAMRFAIDVAYCDELGRVLLIETLKPWRLGTRVAACVMLYEAESGFFAERNVRTGDNLRVIRSEDLT